MTTGSLRMIIKNVYMFLTDILLLLFNIGESYILSTMPTSVKNNNYNRSLKGLEYTFLKPLKCLVY